MIIDTSDYSSIPTQTFTATTLENVKYGALAPGDNVVLLGETPEILTYLDTTGNEQNKVKIHVFHSVSTYAESTGNYVKVRNNEKYTHAIRFPNGKVNPVFTSVGSNILRRHSSPSGLSDLPFDFLQKILEHSEDENSVLECTMMFKKDKNMEFYISKDGMSAFAIVWLGESECMLVGWCHDLDAEGFKWEMEEHLFWVTPTDTYKVYTGKESVFSFFSSNGYLTKEQEQFLNNYESKCKVLSQNPYSDEAKNLRRHVNFHAPELDVLFLPIHEENNTKAYICNFFENKNIVYFQDSILVSEWSVDSIIKRKANEVYSYLSSGRYGVSPYDGSYYVYGEQHEDVVARFEIGVKCKDDYYVKHGDHYLKVDKDCPSDIKAMEKMINMHVLAEKLQL